VRELTTADDDFHVPTSDDIFWTETAWFAFAVPDRRLTAFAYPLFRINQKVCSAAVHVWDDSAEVDHEVLYSHNYWHLPLPDSLAHMKLPSGLSYDVIEPLKTYRLQYSCDEVSFDVTFEGTYPAQLSAGSGYDGNHIDQPGRVRGSMCLHGETIAVDCYEMRDRSWHVRPDASLKLAAEIAQGSYTYAVSGDETFIAKTAGSDRNRTKITGGWLLRDGVLSPLIEGERIAERPTGRPPRRVRVESVDALGRPLVATGTTVNHFAMRATPAIVGWISGTIWEISGAPLWGEDQEWSAGASPRRAGPPAPAARQGRPTGSRSTEV
jgi:hypothetical protein